MNSKSKYEKSLEKRNARPSGPIAPVTPRGVIIRAILEMLIEQAGEEFDCISVTLKSWLEMGLTGKIRGAREEQCRVEIHDRDELGEPLKEAVCLKNGHSVEFAAIGESEAGLRLTLEEILRGRRWGVTLEDLRNGITNGEVLLRNGIDPDVARKSQNATPELN